MDITDFLAKLALETHYGNNAKELIARQTFFNSDQFPLKSNTLIYDCFSDLGYLAHPTTVVELHCQ